MKHDGIITLACDRKSGRWAAQTSLPSQGSWRSYRTGGRLNSAASTHTLLSVALTFAMRSITRKQVETLLKASGHGRAKLLVISDDDEFNSALDDLRRQHPTQRRLRAGRNFLDVLTAQMRRFDFAFGQPDGNYVLALGNWLKLAVLDPKIVETIPATFMPTAVSMSA